MKRLRWGRIGLAVAVGCSWLMASAIAAEQPSPPGTSTASLRDGLPEHAPEGWYARIETSMGVIIAKLLPEQAPQAVAHFAQLARGELPWTDLLTGETRKGRFYDGSQVHRAVAGMRFEAGDPTGTGRGGPAIYIPEEGLGPVNFDTAGRLGMTRAPGHRISAYQFFVTASAQPFLTGRHPCFGVVVSGRDVVMAISGVKTYSNGRPIDPVTIESVRIFAVGDPAPLPKPEPYHPSQRQIRLVPRSGVN